MALILAIDTSCDETSAAVTDGRRMLSNVISSQIDLHKKYGGVFPSLAKRAHEEKIDYVVMEALRRARLCHPERGGKRRVEGSLSSNKERDSSTLSHSARSVGMTEGISAVAVTQGPGLAIALEVGIKKAKELARIWQTKLIAVNHLEGHICSCLAQNSQGKPIINVIPSEVTCHTVRHEAEGSLSSSGDKEIPPLSRQGGIGRNDEVVKTITLQFPTLCLIVSGGHTELVIMKDFGNYTVIGATLDDACGEALDKAARILKLGYPGGSIIERLAEQICVNPLVIRENHKYHFNSPLPQKNNLNFSYSGLKTQLLYLVNSLAENEFNASLKELAASFQSACFEQIIRKTSQAINLYQPKTLLCGGGVIANKQLRKLLRKVADEKNVPIYFPQNKKLITDNAAMIGVAAYYKFLRKEFVENPETLDREPRLSL